MIKHGGCYDCRETTEPILTATTIPELSSGMTAALCSGCRAKRLAAKAKAGG